MNDNFGGRNYDAIGWVASYADSTYSATKVIAPILGKPVQFQAITKAYLDQKAAAAKKILDDATAKANDAKAAQEAAADAAKKASDATTQAKLDAEKAAADKVKADEAAARAATA